ncbi:MAG: hypothetical protein ACI9KE_004983, partial [Polyangiales bacterium]
GRIEGAEFVEDDFRNVLRDDGSSDIGAIEYSALE